MEGLFPCNRRDFIRFASMAGVGATPLAALSEPSTKSAAHAGLKFYIFSKHLQFLDYLDMSGVAKEMGFDGIDLTVRPNGHVLPENVAEDLPAATEAMKSFGLSTNMLTTKVLDADDRLDRKVLETASQNGYKVYRPGWYRYSREKQIQKSARAFGERLRALGLLGEDLGISGS